MSRRTPKAILLILPLLFILATIMLLPAIAGSAEAEHNITALEHSEGAGGVMSILLAGDMILPVLLLLVGVAILVVAVGTMRRGNR
jgi:TRAP-type mannitol/chloroaromatic compound transport system permease small subunit